MAESAREKGLDMFGHFFGEETAEGLRTHMESTDDFAVEMSRWAIDFPFGTVWTRDDLPRKMRSCAVLGMLIALRQHEEIKYHTRMALTNGLSRKELAEVLYSAVPYAGFPAANAARSAMLEVFSELDRDGE